MRGSGLQGQANESPDQPLLERDGSVGLSIPGPFGEEAQAQLRYPNHRPREGDGDADTPGPGRTPPIAECGPPAPFSSPVDGVLRNHGERFASIRGPRSVHHPPPAQSAGDHPASISQSETGQASEIGPGQSYPAADRQALLSLRLVNSSNVCCTHCFLLVWLQPTMPVC